MHNIVLYIDGQHKFAKTRNFWDQFLPRMFLCGFSSGLMPGTFGQSVSLNLPHHVEVNISWDLHRQPYNSNRRTSNDRWIESTVVVLILKRQQSSQAYPPPGNCNLLYRLNPSLWYLFLYLVLCVIAPKLSNDHFQKGDVMFPNKFYRFGMKRLLGWNEVKLVHLPD